VTDDRNTALVQTATLISFCGRKPRKARRSFPRNHALRG
jgi:hypothetical protein